MAAPCAPTTQLWWAPWCARRAHERARLCTPYGGADVTPVVGFAGMTHLGLVSGTAMAARGFDVMCFDADATLIERLRRQDWPVLEPGLDETIRGNGARQRFTALPDDLAACDVVYV